MGMPLMRCESRGDRYPLTPTISTISPASRFAALSSSLWHDRLGHPGAAIFNSLMRNKALNVVIIVILVFVGLAFLEKVKLSFVSSTTTTCMPFDIIHSDLWTLFLVLWGINITCYCWMIILTIYGFFR